MEKKYLVIIDEDKSTRSAALAIVSHLIGRNVKIVNAASFEGIDILGQDYLFFGCANPKPSSFAYLENLLRHINLAGRKCGVFSASKTNGIKSIQYLTSIVKDSEVKLLGKPLISNNILSIQNWTKNILVGETNE
ncbi:MAG: hypothetical protein Ta2B_22490 [Termitinemataceae bacterium]|nr:MAG: hypothetical protein Ta2B_22490 [Termitinemataceae bacterium]